MSFHHSFIHAACSLSFSAPLSAILMQILMRGDSPVTPPPHPTAPVHLNLPLRRNPPVSGSGCMLFCCLGVRLLMWRISICRLSSSSNPDSSISFLFLFSMNFISRLFVEHALERYIWGEIT